MGFVALEDESEPGWYADVLLSGNKITHFKKHGIPEVKKRTLSPAFLKTLHGSMDLHMK